jgi:broad specificity phosphatase PhoE
MTRRVLLPCLIALLAATTSVAQSPNPGGSATVFLVRHAERADTAAGISPAPGSDPPLSEDGRRRAESLATLLKDAHITAIYVTEYRRTQETAAPLAKVLKVTPTTVVSKDLPGLLARIRHASGNVLVVGHSNSVPEAIKGLGVKTPVSIADSAYDDLFIVTARSELIRLHYR